nr:uncharacterized protein LOC119186200 [Rhipicephalus microplus]
MQAEALTIILVFILGDIMIFAAGVNIKQFVNQFELLWTYKTTNRAPIMCEVDHLLSIRPMSITFKRSMLIKGSRCDFRILGVFDKEHKDRMSLIYKDKFQRVENALFVAVGHSCAVFKVESLRDCTCSKFILTMKKPMSLFTLMECNSRTNTSSTYKNNGLWPRKSTGFVHDSADPGMVVNEESREELDSRYVSIMPADMFLGEHFTMNSDVAVAGTVTGSDIVTEVLKAQGNRLTRT